MALQAAAFVRSYEEGRQAPRLPRIPQAAASEPIRILLVICRPKGDKDVPFRSVASRLVKGLRAEASQQVQKMGDDVRSTVAFSSSEQAISGGEPPRAVFSGQQVFGLGDGTAEPAYGSLAQEVMEQGVAGVVAMRYNLYVVTATRLVAEVYEGLAQGLTLGAAVTPSYW